MRSFSLMVMAVAFACLVPAGVASAQKQVTLETGVAADRVLRFDVVRNIKVAQRAGEGAETNTEVETRATIETRVTSASDDGSGKMTAKVLKYSLRLVEPEGPTTVAFDLTGGKPPVITGVFAFDPILRSATFAYDVDAAGKVGNLTGLDEVMEFAARAEGVPPHLFDMFDPTAMTDMLSLLTDPQGGTGEQTVGEAWTTKRRIPFGRAGAFDLETTSAVRLAQSGFAAIAGVTTVTLMAPTERDAATPTVSLTDSDVQTLTNWDTDNGGLMQHSHLMQMTTGWTVGDVTLTQVQRANTSISRLD